MLILDYKLLFLQKRPFFFSTILLKKKQTFFVVLRTLYFLKLLDAFFILLNTPKIKIKKWKN